MLEADVFKFVEADVEINELLVVVQCLGKAMEALASERVVLHTENFQRRRVFEQRLQFTARICGQVVPGEVQLGDGLAAQVLIEHSEGLICDVAVRQTQRGQVEELGGRGQLFDGLNGQGVPVEAELPQASELLDCFNQLEGGFFFHSELVQREMGYFARSIRKKVDERL